MWSDLYGEWGAEDGVGHDWSLGWGTAIEVGQEIKPVGAWGGSFRACKCKWKFGFHTEDPGDFRRVISEGCLPFPPWPVSTAFCLCGLHRPGPASVGCPGLWSYPVAVLRSYS